MNSSLRKKSQKKIHSSGFSLIEMVVVVGSLSVIIVAVISSILLTFRSQNTVSSNDKVSENGRSILAELRRGVFSSDPSKIVCGAGGTAVTVVNRLDNSATTLICVNSGTNNYIAAKSETETTKLSSDEVLVSCQNFVSCTNQGQDIVSVGFSFGLRSVTSGIGSSRVFTTTVTSRK